MDNFVYLYAGFVAVVIVGILIFMLILALKNRPPRLNIPSPSAPPKNHPAQEVLNRLGLKDPGPKTPPKPKSPNLMKDSVKELKVEEILAFEKPPEAVRPPDEPLETIVITQSATDSPEFMDLKAKHERLEALFNEKSKEAQKNEQELNNEVRHRKDFNKIKDLLEKEIKDLKDKNHKLNLEISAAQNEADNQKKRNAQLEEKSAKKDKELLARENTIEELTKKVTNLTGKLPAGAIPIAPPASESQPTPETTAPEPALDEPAPMPVETPTLAVPQPPEAAPAAPQPPEEVNPPPQAEASAPETSLDKGAEKAPEKAA